MTEVVARISQERAEEIAERAVDKALARFFILLDIDVTQHEHIRNLRENLEYIQAQRLGSERLKDGLRKAALPVITTALAAGTWWLWDVIRAGFAVSHH